jgi:hypothetical protein
MSKLFDKKDHAWELAQIDRAEQEAASQLTGFELARMEDVGRSALYRLSRSKLGPAVGAFEKLRSRSRMKLLKTVQLMNDLRQAMALFKACPHCKEDAKGLHACEAHRKIVRGSMLAVKYAGEDNMPTRLAQGRVWGDEEPVPAHERQLNEWEAWYYRDKRDGIWPGTMAYTGSVDDVAKLRQEYGSVDYKGWLQFIFEEEEISYGDFIAEKERLNAANCA